MIRLESPRQLTLQYQISPLVREQPCFYNRLAPTNYFFQLIDEEQFDTIVKQSELEQLTKKKKILCKVCHYFITSLDQKIQVNGTYHHTAIKPIVEIICNILIIYFFYLHCVTLQKLDNRIALIIATK